MENQARRTTRVGVGAPPSGFTPEIKPWEIIEVDFHGFPTLPAIQGEEVESPDFKCLGHRWKLEIYPRGDEDADDGMISVCLCKMASRKSIKISYFINVWGPTGKQVAHHYEPDSNTFDATGIYDARPWHIRHMINFAKRSKILNALVDGTLTIEVRMRKVSGPPSSISVEFVPENPICKNILSKFGDAESADVVFEVRVSSEQGTDSDKRSRTCTTFHAHRFILQMGAPVLVELCKPGGKGGVTPVAINNVKPKVFRHMLYHTYGGELTYEEMEEYAKELIDAADKFDVASLKLEAEAFYVKSTVFTSGNILDNLLYAHSKNCALLKEAAMEFIAENGKVIVDEVSFESVPGSMMKDLLIAVNREKQKDDDGIYESNYKNMRVGALRKLLHEKGLDVDGSREAMIAVLEDYVVSQSLVEVIPRIR